MGKTTTGRQLSGNKPKDFLEEMWLKQKFEKVEYDLEQAFQ